MASSSILICYRIQPWILREKYEPAPNPASSGNWRQHCKKDRHAADSVPQLLFAVAYIGIPLALIKDTATLILFVSILVLAFIASYPKTHTLLEEALTKKFR